MFDNQNPFIKKELESRRKASASPSFREEQILPNVRNGSLENEELEEKPYKDRFVPIDEPNHPEDNAWETYGEEKDEPVERDHVHQEQKDYELSLYPDDYKGIPREEIEELFWNDTVHKYGEHFAQFLQNTYGTTIPWEMDESKGQIPEAQEPKGKDLSPEEKAKWDEYGENHDPDNIPYHTFDPKKYTEGFADPNKSEYLWKQFKNKVKRNVAEGTLTLDEADKQLGEAVNFIHRPPVIKNGAFRRPGWDPESRFMREKVRAGFKGFIQKGVKKPEQPDRAAIREMLHYQPESSKESLISRFGTVVPSEIEKQIQEGILRGEFQEVPENFDEIAFEDPDFGQKLAQEEYTKKQQSEAVDHEATRKWLEEESDWYGKHNKAA